MMLSFSLVRKKTLLENDILKNPKAIPIIVPAFA